MKTTKTENTDMKEGSNICAQIDIEDLKSRVKCALTNIHLSEWIELDAELYQANTEEARKVSIMMWTTILGVAEKRRQSKLEQLKNAEAAPVESWYTLPEMPYGTRPGYKVLPGSIADEILSLPYGDPEFIFDWSKLLDQGRSDKSKRHPRVVIQVCGNRVREVSSDLPVEYFVLHEFPDVPASDRAEEAIDTDLPGTSSSSSSEFTSEAANSSCSN